MNIDLREEKLSAYKDSFGFHYSAILAYLSTCFNDSIIVDLGTLYGNSAAALAYNKTNKVYTYDIKSKKEAISKFELKEFKNIEYIITNCIENNWDRQSDRDIFLSSKLIFLDVDPHDGIQEEKVLRFLVENEWKGIMICDDIGSILVERPLHLPMCDWWNSIDLPNFNIVNRYSSPTGTGIICFDNQRVTYTSLSQEEITYKKKQSRLDPATWVYSEKKEITRFDDGTFETNDGITGTWDVIYKADGKESIFIKTQDGSLEIPVTKN